MAPDLDALENRVLIYDVFGGDAELTSRALAQEAILAQTFSELEALCAAVREGAGAVLLGEEALVPASAERILETLEGEPPWSDLPILVSTTEFGAARHGVGPVALLGQRTHVVLLDRPMRMATTLNAIRVALRGRRRQYELRDLLRQIASSEARFRRVQEVSPDAFMLLRPLTESPGTIVDFTWAYANRAAEQVVGRSYDELIGQRLLDRWPQFRKEGHFDAYVRAYGAGAGEVRELLLGEGTAASVYRNTAFRVDAELGLFFQDITDRKRADLERQALLASEKEARARAEASNRGKDEFLGVVSHELRTPLNAMLGWARMLRAGQLDAKQALRALDAIERNAVAQAQLIEDLLDVSRIVSGKLRLDVREVNVRDVVELAIDSVRAAIGAKGIRFEPSVDAPPAHVMGDPNRIQQIIWNLLSNAIKFTPKGGKVSLTLRRAGPSIVISVSDTGQGLHPSFLPYLFQRFHQADASQTRVQGGLGLGLAISRHLVELHGGTISAESSGPGTGATFRIELPLIAARESPTRHPHPASVPPEGFECPPELEGLKVLVVDDEPDARELLVAVLRRCGALPTEAGTAAEALECLTSTRPDVIVSDIGMPTQDGYDLIRRVRQLSAADGGRTPAAALTAYARAEDRRRALRAGFELHISKPVEPAELVASLAALARIGTAMR